MTQTAEELLANNIDAIRDLINDDDLYFFYRGIICEFAKGFAEMHVTEALKMANDRAKNCHIDELIDDEILNAYPLTNIK